MIEGRVEDDGAPVIYLPLGQREWRAIIDTGFNGDLELPFALGPIVNADFTVALDRG